MKNTLLIFLTFFNLFCFSQNYNHYIKRNEYKEALPLLKTASKKGDPEAQYILGNWYKKGIVVDFNQKKSAELYLKSAQQNYNKALMAIVQCYIVGDGVAQNYEKAFAYGLQCAKNGYFDCIAGIVDLYINEIGTKANPEEILKWSKILTQKEFTKDKLHDAVIIFNRLKIAQLYKEGNILKQDNFNSYVWYLMYNELKEITSEYQQKKVVLEIKTLEPQLTSQQKIDAKLKAEKLLNRKIINVNNLLKVEKN